MPTKSDPSKILDEAMQLEPTMRAFIAETLLESPDLDRDFPVSLINRSTIKDIKSAITSIIMA